MSWKRRLAREIVARYHGAEVGAAEEAWFTNTISNKNAPADAPQVKLDAPITWLDWLRKQLPDRSANDLRRLIQQGGVQIDGEKVVSPTAMVEFKGEGVVKVGKLNWFRLVR
jgi:tyrosyl-tRNA synthetase